MQGETARYTHGRVIGPGRNTFRDVCGILIAPSLESRGTAIDVPGRQVLLLDQVQQEAVGNRRHREYFDLP